MKSFFVNLQEAFEKSEIIGRDRVAVSDVQILCLTQPSTQTSDCREWAIQQLQLLEGVFGREYMAQSLSRKRTCITMFSGVECCRTAWQYVEAAAGALYDLQTGLHFRWSVLCQHFRYG